MDSIPSTMKALLKSEAQASYRLVELPVPKPSVGQTLIKIERVGICGSDIGLYKWDSIGQSIATLPFTPGHEAVGIVVMHGDNDNIGRDDVSVGTRVCVENHYYCGDCFQCKHDQPHICQAMGQFGHGMGKNKLIASQGGFAEYALVPTRNLYPITTKISIDEACLLEPFGVAHHACESCEVKEGDDCLVLGCGTIGLFAVQVAKAMGASKIIASDIDDAKLELAVKMGATVTINPLKSDLKKVIFDETNQNGAGHIIEASGATTNVNNCFSYARKGGYICLVGIPKESIQILGNPKDFLFRSLTIRSIHGRKIFHTWIESEKLMDGKVDATQVITHRYSMTDYENAFDALISGKAVKVLIDPQK